MPQSSRRRRRAPATGSSASASARRLDLLATSSGQTLLAFQDDIAREETLARWAGTQAAAAYAKLAPALARYRKAGHRIGMSQQIKGVDDISVPVLASRERVIAVLTCPYIERLDKASAGTDETLAALKEVAGRLSTV